MVSVALLFVEAISLFSGYRFYEPQRIVEAIFYFSPYRSPPSSPFLKFFKFFNPPYGLRPSTETKSAAAEQLVRTHAESVVK